jgi:hypothetical protein
MKTFTFVLAVVLLSATALHGQGTTESDQVTKVRLRHADALIELDRGFDRALAKSPKDRPKTCSLLVQVLGSINESMWQTAEQYRVVMEDSPLLLERGRLFAGMILDSADLAKKKGCYNFADAEYRKVIQTFIGLGYAAHRQRAQIGLDDIRHLQSQGKGKL